MRDVLSPFRNACFPVGCHGLAVHANIVTCILAGRNGSVRLNGQDSCVEGEVLLVRPGVAHSVTLPARGADVLYLNGLDCPFDAPLGVPLDGALAYAARDALNGSGDAAANLRAQLTPAFRLLTPAMGGVVNAIHADPMWRMSQGELARRLGLERTQALRCFKAATGQGFREYKLWSALQYATQQLVGGALVRTAAMDAGFSDTAHLSRVFRHIFGLTPSAAIRGMAL
ncbi:MAG: AraC family transcriptional regulator [Sphingopyxis sp.]|uniref:helix-turn-helix domain-containing protein n=1 Tax=Sphingopyxis sp. TaxID=1908224 RepID=UPI002ABAE7BC|nr:AraC family transcriptional regulator [Sphingopyxis sp.]MDZ3832725.1 AraC family transcriptional regulator [Sphingopyxis sp.]